MSDLNLPADVADVARPLFDALPLGQAMTRLICPMHGGTPEQVQLVESIVAQPAVAGRPALVAALWLYIDELDRSHSVSQSIDNPTGSYWHGIMHRREGDFGNSHYWFRKTGDHPAMAHIPNYDAHAFIDEVESAQRSGEGQDALVQKQRQEWQTLFVWCATQ